MSGSTAKFERREVRRAFGDTAIAAIDKHGEAIANIDVRTRTNLHQQETRLGFFSDRLDATDADVDQLRAALASEATLRMAFETRTWRHRLRWLFWGE